ncbi:MULTISPECIES: M20 family metallopeptidase [Flavobacteriaceae]|uniref:M20 family metallopeptidase n=1 Tax=Flavobacteriaceae TaxID=49546 RepID=UPI00149194CE|nr:MULTISPECIES: M20 family metallopeptidase [Allomuricauda]MDC6366811.1 M20 family metallopeptidase [Muricauda sp. AC10]
MDVIELSQKLIQFDTRVPKGNEGQAALFLGGILEANGFEVDYPEFAKGRLNLVASKGLGDVPPLVFTGHFDVVPLGDAKWSVNPFGGSIHNGKLYGRGASDMKAAVAAMVCAATSCAEDMLPKGGIKLLITANEELGCLGAKALRDSGYHIGGASALVVGEPTSNQPLLGHKGGLYLKATTHGKTAHSSTPHLGDNAIYKAAKAVLKLDGLEFAVAEDGLLGHPTINVGKFQGGQNLNSVPDYAQFTIDVRTTPKLPNHKALTYLQSVLGKEVELEKLVDLDPVTSNAQDPFIKRVVRLCNGAHKGEAAAPYLTDASVITPWLGNVPTVILGPGEAQMAHKTDEYCAIDKILESVALYKAIIKAHNIQE